MRDMPKLRAALDRHYGARSTNSERESRNMRIRSRCLASFNTLREIAFRSRRCGLARRCRI
jgi:hypothetical protein